MKIKNGFVMRELANECIVVPVETKEHNFHGMIQLNSTGAFLWKLLEKGNDRQTMAQKLFDEYETTFEQAQKDTDLFIETLEKAGILCE